IDNRNSLTESKQKFQWTKECEDSFLQLKEALTSSPILIYPQPDKPFILDTDASNESVGAVLSQEIDGQERVVAYWSKCLSKPERNYCVTRKELLAIVKAIEHFHHYLYGQKFLLRTDHASLTWLMNFRNTEGQVARWIQRLNEYYFDIRHRKGSSHGNADALSRRPCPENCRHCSRVETKYDYAIRQITTSTATPPDPWSDEKVREDQMADPDIKPLKEFMESSSNKPSWQDISAYSPTTKQYWALWNSLHLRNGVLYRKFESEDGKTFRWQLVLPRSRIPEVLKELHGSPTGGHFGVMKTLHRVRGRFFWVKKPPYREAVVQHWDIEIWGTSSTSFRSGRNFVSAVLKGVCELLGIDKTKTTPLHPHAVHETTGYSPSPDAFLPRSSPLQTRRLVALRYTFIAEEYVQNLQARFEDVHNLARERINLRTEKMKTRYDTKATGHQFKEGDKKVNKSFSGQKNVKIPSSSLKEALTSSPILIYPQPDKPFILDTDASNESVGAVLSQEIDGQERVVAYWSKCLSKPERNYCHSKRATGYCEKPSSTSITISMAKNFFYVPIMPL
ncbi:retrovirus-related Pol polyprotein from transposon 412, partial [Trichonephila clavipes]